MDEFLYQIELTRINSITKQPNLIKELSNSMEVTGRQIVNLLRRNLSIKQVVLSGLSADSRTIQITTIYKYGLYVSARQHYFELDLDIFKTA